MSVEAVRRVSRSGGAVVRPQAISDKTYVESVVSFLHEVVPQAVTGTQRQEDKEKVLWVKFEQGDINDVTEHQEDVRNGSPLPLLLILGYTNGFQIWIVPSSGEAQELVSLRQGPVRLVRILQTPNSAGNGNRKDEFAGSRPLFAICDAASPSVPFSTVNLWSMSSGEQVHSVGFKSEVYDVLSNKRLMVVALQEKIAAFDACTMKSRFCVMSCYPAPSPNLNPLAVGSTWLAFADQKLVPNHQSCGGISGDHVQSYTATVINAAKTLTRGLTMFGETVGRLTGSHSTESLNEISVPVNQKTGKGVPVPGVVTVVDTSRIGSGEFCVQEDDHEGSGIVAHFLASAGEPISALAFDTSESLLVTADSLGHNFHVFRLMPHPVCSSLGAVHHLYTLHRGETTATVHSISFSLDSRWVAVSTLRGTTHVFPITTYGGPVTVRTHTSPRVVNRSSRFHTSAGLDDIDHARTSRISTGSTQNSSGSPNGSPRGVPTTFVKDNFILGGGGSNGLMNPRLPPLPHPTVVYPLAQVKTPINTRCSGSCCSGTGSSSAKCSGKLMPETLGNSVQFAVSRGWLALTSNPTRAEPSRAIAVDSLFVLDLHGNLTEYVLEPQATKGVPQSEETPLELLVTSRAQWPLTRSPTLPEHKLPLTKGHPILKTTLKELHQLNDCASSTKTGKKKIKVSSGDSECPSSEGISVSLCNRGNSNETNDHWLSNIEMESHASPHRRLWMGPQFAFKTFQPPGSLSFPGQVIGDSRTGNGATITPHREGYPMDFYAEELDLQSLRLQPVKSDPVPTPSLSGAFTGWASSNLGGTMPLVAVDNGPGSLNDPYGSWPEVCNGTLEDKEDHLVETLAEAMNENATVPVKREKLGRSCSESSQGETQFEFQSDSAGGCISAFASCSPTPTSPLFPPSGSPEWS